MVKQNEKGHLLGAGPGRPKGLKNKVGMSAKEAIAWAADRLGGPLRLYEWALESEANERDFWVKIYPKLLPLQLYGGGPDGIVLEIVRFSDAPVYRLPKLVNGGNGQDPPKAS